MEQKNRPKWETRHGELMEITFYSSLSFLVALILGVYLGLLA